MLIKLAHLSTEVDFDVDENWNVLFLKQRAAQIFGVESDLYDIFLGNQRLDESLKLSHFPLRADCRFDLRERHARNRFFVYCYQCEEVSPASLVFTCKLCGHNDFVLSDFTDALHDVSGSCNFKNCPSHVASCSFLCLRSSEHQPVVYLKHIKRNLDFISCVACFSDNSDVVINFCDNSSHSLCLACFKKYGTEYLNGGLFQLVEDLGYTLGCPAGCPHSFITDPHHFRILGANFYSRYKEFAASRYLLDKNSVICPGCGQIWEICDDAGRPNSHPQRLNWFTCHPPLGCGCTFCASCLWFTRELTSSTPLTCNCLSSGRDISARHSRPYYDVRVWNALSRGSGDVESQKTIAKTCRLCPRCKSATEKAGGCNHIHCCVCGFDWCWVCCEAWMTDSVEVPKGGPNPMSAGAVRAPLIIPVRDPEIGCPSSKIDSRTLLDLMSDTPNVDIYFTINGGRPVIKKHERELLNAGTYKFHNPFTLPPGVQTIRAVAYLPSTGCESNMVTKTFDVLRAPGTAMISKASDDFQFLEDLKAIEAHRKKSSRKRSDKSDPEDFISKLIEADQNSHNAQLSEEKSDAGVSVSPSGKHTASKMVMCDLIQQCAEQSEKCDSDVKTPRRLSDSSQTSLAPDAGKPSEESNPRRSVPEYPVDASVSFRRLQRATDILRCPYCLKPRPPGRTQQFCGYCGQALPRLPDADTSALGYDRLGKCTSCGSIVPFSLSTCLACEAPLVVKTEDKDPQSQELRVCTNCGAPNPSHVSSCLTCEARLASGTRNLVSPNTVRSQRIRPTLTPSSANALMLNASNPVGAPSQSKFISCPQCQRENNADARYCGWCGLEVHGCEMPYTDKQCWWSSSGTPVQRPRDSASFYYSQGDGPPPRSYEMRNTDVNQQNVRCTKCGRMVDTNAKFCSNCGSRIEPNLRTMSWTTVTNMTGANEANSYWQSDNRTMNRQHGPSVSNATTQTVGLFYPSSAELRRKESLNSSRSTNDLLHDRTPLLTAVSPGRGFWRKQVDHIVAHLKVYASNNPEFRAALGEPRFGKLISANLREGRTEARITLTYALPRTPSAKRMEDYEKPPQRSRTETTAVEAQLRRSDGEISRHNGRTRHGSFVGRKTDSAKTNGSQEDNDSDRASVTLHSNPQDQVVSDDSYEFVADMNEKQFSQSLADLSQSYGMDDLSDGFESAEPQRRPEQRKTTKVPKRRSNGNKVKRSDSDAGERNSARSRNTTSSRGSTSSRKSGADQSKHMEVGKHPGEAGVALLRESKLTTSDRALLHLLSEPGEGTEDDINRALKEGANPNCVNVNGETPLVLAVHSRSLDAIPILLNAGAKVNAPGTLNGNTALHEAVLAGFDGVEMAEVLLHYGASPKCKNKRNETPQALAVRLRCEPMTRLFVANMGQSELQKLTGETSRTDLSSVITDGL